MAAVAMQLHVLFQLLGVLSQPVLCQSNGPCVTPEPARVLLAPGGGDTVVAANFGLLFPAAPGAGWQWVCDDRYGKVPAERMWRLPGGRLLAGSEQGLLWSDDGCDWRAAEGTGRGQAVLDLVVDPAGSPPPIWMMVRATSDLLISRDGGVSFAPARSFPQIAMTARLALAGPAGGRRLYLQAGFQPAGASVLWAWDQAAGWSGPQPLGTTGRLVAGDPADPKLLYFLVSVPQGDELWVSRDAGATTILLLKLPDFELYAGLAFGASPGTLYVAGRAPIVVDDLPPGRLYISRDGGASWLPPVRSGPRGPAYRCLVFADGQLHACGGGESAGEDFFLGVSRDEGQSWTPTLRLAEVHGAKACVRAACAATEVWLCEAYGSCASRLDAGVADAGAADAAAADAGGPEAGGGGSDTNGRIAAGGGCSCQVGSRAPAVRLPTAMLVLLLVLLLGLLALVRRRA